MPSKWFSNARGVGFVVDSAQPSSVKFSHSSICQVKLSQAQSRSAKLSQAQSSSVILQSAKSSSVKLSQAQSRSVKLGQALVNRLHSLRSMNIFTVLVIVVAAVAPCSARSQLDPMQCVTFVMKYGKAPDGDVCKDYETKDMCYARLCPGYTDTSCKQYCQNSGENLYGVQCIKGEERSVCCGRIC